MQKGRKTLQTDTHVLIYSWAGCSLPARWTSITFVWTLRERPSSPHHELGLLCHLLHVYVRFIYHLVGKRVSDMVSLVLTHRFAHRLLLRDLEWCWKCAFPVVDMMLSHVNNWFTGSLLWISTAVTPFWISCLFVLTKHHQVWVMEVRPHPHSEPQCFRSYL